MEGRKRDELRVEWRVATMLRDDLLGPMVHPLSVRMLGRFGCGAYGSYVSMVVVRSKSCTSGR